MATRGEMSRDSCRKRRVGSIGDDRSGIVTTEERVPHPKRQKASDAGLAPASLEGLRFAWEQAVRDATTAKRAYHEALVRERCDEYHQGVRELEAIADAIAAGEQQRPARLTDLPPTFDGVDPAPLVELRLALRRWRRVRQLQNEATENPDAVPAFVDAQPRTCPLAWQPVGFFAVVLGSGWLLHALGRLAPCARVFGARRGRALWGQRRGLSMCEALARLLCTRLDPADARAAEMWLCASAGRQLLCVAIQPDAENTAHYEEVLAAARSKSGVEALQEARARGVSVNARANKKRATAIMAASARGDADAVGHLIAMRAALDLQTTNGLTAIMITAYIGHTTIATALIGAGAALDLQDTKGQTAIMNAVGRGRTTIVTSLIGAGAALDLQTTNGLTAIMVAARRGHATIVTALIGAGAALDLQDADGWTAIMHAAHHGHAGIVTALIGVGAALDLQDAKGWTAIMFAVRKGHTAVATALIGAGAALDLQDAKGWTAIARAVRFGHAAIVTALIEAGAALDLQDAAGWTAIMIAAGGGHTTIASALIGAGAALDMQTKNGFAAIMLAARNGHTAVATALVGAGAALDLRSKDGWTALMLAAFYGRITVATALVVAGAALDLQTNSGSTALMHAAQEGHPTIETALIAAGASFEL